MESSVFILFLAFFCIFANGMNNGLGRLPPMGWSTWCTEGSCGRDFCNEEEVKSIGDFIVESGMIEIGYQYVNLDDCWAWGRDSEGNILPDPNRFPSGMKAVADYLHSLGLKFGLYTDAGLYTCSQGGRNHKIPGSYGYYEQDAFTYASWTMDYVKMDWCNTLINGTQLDPRIQYPQMSKALNATGRPIFFALCEWGVDQPWTWAAPISNSWRSGGDHHDQWESLQRVIETNANLSSFAGAGAWNDADFLMTGGQGCSVNTNMTCPGMTQTEYITEFTIWSIIGSPMIVATDIRNMTAEKKSILFNTEVIAVSQDPKATPGGQIGSWECSEGAKYCQIWARPLYDGSYALVLYNSGNYTHSITADFSLLNWENEQVFLRDLWAHEDLGVFTGSFTAKVASHGVVMTKAQRTNKKFV